MIIRFDWVSKFTLSLLSALKVSITFGWAMNGIHCLNRSNRIHYWCYSNQWYRYIIHVYLHGKSSQRKGDIYKYLRLNPPGNEVDSRWNLKALHQKQTREKLDIGKIWGGFLPQNGVESSQKLDVHSKS